MKTFFNHIILLLCLTILGTSCKKDVEIFIPEVLENDKANIRSFIKQDPERYILEIDEASQFLSTNTGLIIEIPSESLLNQDGSRFTGKVLLETAEIERNLNFFNFELSSQTERSYLIPERMFLVNFTYQGKPLKINENNPVLIKTIDVDNMIPMNICYWENKHWKINGPAAFMKWKSVFGENSIEEFGYNIQVNKNGWYAIGHEPLNIAEPGSGICAKTTNQFGPSNTIGFLFLKNRAVTIPLLWSEKESAFCTDKIAPSDIESGVFVMVSWQNNKHYLGIKNIDSIQSKILPCDLISATPEQILAEISKL